MTSPQVVVRTLFRLVAQFLWVDALLAMLACLRNSNFCFFFLKNENVTFCFFLYIANVARATFTSDDAIATYFCS